MPPSHVDEDGGGHRGLGQPRHRRLARLDGDDGGRSARRRSSKVRPAIADTASIGFNFVTGGSRVTFATGMAVVTRLPR